MSLLARQPATFDEFVSSLAEISPHSAVLESWRRVDRSIDYYFDSRGRRRPARQAVSQILATDTAVGPKVVAVLDDLRKIRNKAAHEDVGPLTRERAVEFAGRAFAVMGSLTAIRAEPPRKETAQAGGSRVR